MLAVPTGNACIVLPHRTRTHVEIVGECLRREPAHLSAILRTKDSEAVNHIKIGYVTH